MECFHLDLSLMVIKILHFSFARSEVFSGIINKQGVIRYSQTVLPDINCHVWWDLICCVWVTRAWPLDRVLWSSHRVNGPGSVIHQGSSEPQGEMFTHFLIKHAEHQISVLNLIMTLSHISLNWMKVTRDLDTKFVSIEDSFRRALAGPDKKFRPLADPAPQGLTIA